MQLAVYDVCDVTLSLYPHRASLKNIPDYGGNRTYDFENTSPMLCQLSYAVRSVRVCDKSPGIFFKLAPMWIYTQSNITNIIYSPEYITPTQKIHDY